MSKMMIKAVSISLFILMLLAAAPVSSAVTVREDPETDVPEMVKGTEWSQSMEINFNNLLDNMEFTKMFDEIGTQLKMLGMAEEFDVDLDIDGGMGLFMTSEVVDVGVDVSGEECNHLRTSAFFGSGLRIDLGVDVEIDIEGEKISVDGSGSAGYYLEFDAILDMWVTTDELALVKAEVKISPFLDADVSANVKGTFDNVNFDINVNGNIKTDNILAKAIIEFDDPFDYLDLPVEENEEWYVEGFLEGVASVSGKIEMELDVSGIPGEDDIHEKETIDLAEETEGSHEFEEYVELNFGSGETTSVPLSDGSTTQAIPIYNLDILELFEDDWDDDYYYDDDWDDEWYYETRDYEDDYDDDDDDDYYYDDDDDYYYDDDYYDDYFDPFDYLDMFGGSFLGDLENMGPDDLAMNQYYAPELGMFVKTEIGLTEEALDDLDDPKTKETLSVLRMDMEPATKEEVESFKDSRSPDYFSEEEKEPEENWIVLGLGLLVALIVVFFVLILLIKRKGKKKKQPSFEPTGSDEGAPQSQPEADPYLNERGTGRSPPERRMPPPPDDYY